MNRILKLNNGHMVLITPTYNTSPDMSLMLGNWTDQRMRGYSIVTCHNLQDAIDIAYKYPPIDWNKLINIHIDSFKMISNTIKHELANGNFIVEIDSHLMNPTELKETMFKRVLQQGRRFNLYYDANDIISINIINPWTANLNEIADTLRNNTLLHIVNIERSKTHITLIGITSVGTTYEIRLWTSIIANTVRWILNNNVNPNIYSSMIQQAFEKQKVIDMGDIIR